MNGRRRAPSVAASEVLGDEGAQRFRTTREAPRRSDGTGEARAVADAVRTGRKTAADEFSGAMTRRRFRRSRATRCGAPWREAGQRRRLEEVKLAASASRRRTARRAEGRLPARRRRRLPRAIAAWGAGRSPGGKSFFSAARRMCFSARPLSFSSVKPAANSTTRWSRREGPSTPCAIATRSPCEPMIAGQEMRRFEILPCDSGCQCANGGRAAPIRRARRSRCGRLTSAEKNILAREVVR